MANERCECGCEAKFHEHGRSVCRGCFSCFGYRPAAQPAPHQVIKPSDAHPQFHREVNCVICDGGLGVCKVCGKAEVELREPCAQPAPQDVAPSLSYQPLRERMVAESATIADLRESERVAREEIACLEGENAAMVETIADLRRQLAQAEAQVAAVRALTREQVAQAIWRNCEDADWAGDDVLALLSATLAGAAPEPVVVSPTLASVISGIEETCQGIREELATIWDAYAASNP